MRRRLKSELNRPGLQVETPPYYQRVSWIEVVDHGKVEPLLRTELDAGEAAVISLGLKKSQTKVLIDERKARKIARLVYGLEVLGTVRVLIEA